VACFATEQEVYDTIGRLFVEIMDDPELLPQFQRANAIVRYAFTDPDSTITVKMREGEDGQVDLGPSALEPDVVMSMPADTAHRFWLGEVNITVALARGQIKAKGPVAKVLRLVPLVRPVFPRYRAQLETDGRTELL
jgi:SCP-2 sterol transfer family protein